MIAEKIKPRKSLWRAQIFLKEAKMGTPLLSVKLFFPENYVLTPDTCTCDLIWK